MRKLGSNANGGREAMMAFVDRTIQQWNVQQSMSPVEERVVDEEHQRDLPHECQRRRQRRKHQHASVLQQVIQVVDHCPLHDEVRYKQRPKRFHDQRCTWHVTTRNLVFLKQPTSGGGSESVGSVRVHGGML
jgi:hypothetical protein